jgi:hypothetical protein
MKIAAKTKEKPTPVEVDYAIPDGLPALTTAFGAEVVAAHAKGSIVISAQAFMRRLIEKGKSQKDIQDELSKWKPDLRVVVKQSAEEKAQSAIKNLTAEARASLLKQLQLELAGGAKPVKAA